jgi:hypothetical protein
MINYQIPNPKDNNVPILAGVLFGGMTKWDLLGYVGNQAFLVVWDRVLKSRKWRRALYTIWVRLR